MSSRLSHTLQRLLAPLGAALALAGAVPAAHAETELTFELAPRDFSNDSVGSWSLAYERLVDAQFAVGLAVGWSDIQGPVKTSQGVSAALRATHYLQQPSNAPRLQPYVGLEVAGATHTSRQSTTLGAFVGARFPLAPTMDLRTNILFGSRKTTEESLFGSDGAASDRRTVTSLRLGVTFRY